MAYIDNHSTPAGNEELNLFSVPPTQIGINSTYPVVYYPKNPIDSTGPILFEVPPVPHFINVASNTLQLKLRILKANGTNLAAVDKVSPINYILNTLWQQIRLFVSSKLLWDSGNLFAYKAIFESNLGFSKAEKETYLSSALYYNDTGNDLSQGGKDVATLFDLSAEVVVIGSLHIDVLSQNRLWPPRVGFSIELFRNSNAFLLRTPAGSQDEFKLEILEAKMQFTMVETLPSLNIAFERTLAKVAGCKYPIRRSEIKILHLEQGRYDLVMSQLHSGVLPRRVIVAFVSSEAFHGSFRYNPFNMFHFNLSYIELVAGGRHYPPTPLEMNFEKKEFIHVYHLLNRTVKNDSGIPCGITRDDFINGNMFVCFDLTPDNSASDQHFNVVNAGVLELMAKFKSPLTAALKVLCYLEFDSILTLNSQRQFYLDYKI